MEAAQGLATRLLTEAEEDQDRLRLVFEVVLSRPPRSKEVTQLAEFLERERDRFAQDPAAA